MTYPQNKPIHKRRRHSPFERQRTITGVLFLLPTTILCFVFVVLPLINVIDYSFFAWNGVSAHKDFVGLANYVALPSTEGFYAMARATLIYAVGCTLLIVAVAFALAMALDKRGPWRVPRGLLRSMWFFPCLLSGAVVGILWRIMYNYNNGVINTIIKQLGGTAVNWLETPGVTMFAIIIATVWSQVGLCIIVFMAGLQSISVDLYEAAAIDGANAGGLRRHITIPLMAPSITINVLTTTIATFKMYELPYTISQGLPGYSTRLLTQRIYFYAFEAMDYGIGSALSVMLILIITLISLVQLYVLRRREDIY